MKIELILKTNNCLISRIRVKEQLARKRLREHFRKEQFTKRTFTKTTTKRNFY